jgi:Thiamine monophosphate synthase
MSVPANRFEITDWAAGAYQDQGHLQGPALDLRVYAVTDAAYIVRSGYSMSEAVGLVIQGGATMVQLREKDLDGGPFLANALKVVQIARPSQVSSFRQISFYRKKRGKKTTL